jgi:hypothetical protein
MHILHRDQDRKHLVIGQLIYLPSFAMSAAATILSADAGQEQKLYTAGSQPEQNRAKMSSAYHNSIWESSAALIRQRLTSDVARQLPV